MSEDGRCSEAPVAGLRVVTQPKSERADEHRLVHLVVGIPDQPVDVAGGQAGVGQRASDCLDGQLPLRAVCATAVRRLANADNQGKGLLARHVTAPRPD